MNGKTVQNMDKIPSTPGIYVIRNLINGNFYVGSAVNLKERHRGHFKDLRRKKHHNRHLQRAFLKYGEDAFVFEILEHVEVKENLVTREQHYIDLLSPQYNIAPKAGSALGVKHTDETKAKVSAAGMGRVKSDATRAKASATLKGRIITPEWRANMSKCRKGKPSPKKGMPISEEQKAKLSATHKGKILSAEHRAKIGDGVRGKKNPSEKLKSVLVERNKQRAGIPHTPEHKAKISESGKRRYEKIRIAKEQERQVKEQALLVRWEHIGNDASTLDPSEYKPVSLWDKDWSEDAAL